MALRWFPRREKLKSRSWSEPGLRIGNSVRPEPGRRRAAFTPRAFRVSRFHYGFRANHFRLEGPLTGFSVFSVQKKGGPNRAAFAKWIQ